MSAHILKAWPTYFSSVWSGDKAFELRRNDRGYQVGDVLLLREYDSEREDLPAGERYTGRELSARVTYLLSGFPGLKEGYVVMSLKILQRSGTSSRLPKEAS